MPPLWDLIVEQYDRCADYYRLLLLEWLFNFEDGFVKKVRNIDNFKPIATVIVTLEYLLQVSWEGKKFKDSSIECIEC